MRRKRREGRVAWEGRRYRVVGPMEVGEINA